MTFQCHWDPIERVKLDSLAFRLRRFNCRQVFLFQSVRQLLSWLAIVLFLIGLTTAFEHLFSMRPTEFFARTIAIALGSLPSVLLCFPATIRLSGHQRGYTSKLMDIISTCGYRQPTPVKDGWTMLQKGPDFWRWDESTIIISRDGDFTNITGPWYVLSKVCKIARKYEI